MRWFKRRPKRAVLTGLGDTLVVCHKGIPQREFILVGFSHSFDGMEIQFKEKSYFMVRDGGYEIPTVKR